MQPYQEATEETLRQSSEPGNILKSGAKIGATLFGASTVGALSKKILPFLNKLVPANLAVKGLKNVDPRFGKFVDYMVADGYTIDEARDFIGDKFSKDEDISSEDKRKVALKEFTQRMKKKPSMRDELQEQFQNQYGSQRNILEQYSPELFQFVNSQIQNGSSPLQAATEAAKSGKFSQAIKKIQDDHKTGWGNIVQQIFGGGKEAIKNPSQQQGQSGNADQALMAALDKILKM